jgi:hypothetical protein
VFLASGMSKEQWRQLKEKEASKVKGKNLGQVGITPPYGDVARLTIVRLFHCSKFSYYHAYLCHLPLARSVLHPSSRARLQIGRKAVARISSLSIPSLYVFEQIPVFSPTSLLASTFG